MTFCEKLNKNLKGGQLTGFLNGIEGTPDYVALFDVARDVVNDDNFDPSKKLGLNKKLLYSVINYFQKEFQPIRVKKILGQIARGELAKLETVGELIEYLKTVDDVETLIKSVYSVPSYQGGLYERVWDIIVKFGCCDKFSNNEYYQMEGNIGVSGNPKELVNMKKYCKGKIISGNSGGASDITLRKKDDGSWIFISCKYYIKERGVEFYDLAKIFLPGTINYGGMENYTVYFFVKNKKGVLEKVDHANRSNNLISQHMTEDKILDIKDLQRYFLVWKDTIKQFPDPDTWDLEILGIVRPWLKLKFHQRLIVDNTIKKDKQTMLWGCKPRSGKTFMAGGYIDRLRQKLGILNVLVITPAPTETLTQWVDDFFNKYQNFNDRIYDKFEIRKSGKELLSHQFRSDISTIIILSKQLLQNKEYLAYLPALDLIVFDETHFGGTTGIAEGILKTISNSKTKKLFLTATWQKPAWIYKPDCTQFWDLIDEHWCKTGNVRALTEKHGHHVTILLSEMYGDNIDLLKKEYSKYPELSIISSIWDTEKIMYKYAYDCEFDTPDIKRGFSMETLFSISDKFKFKFTPVVEEFIRYVEKDVYKKKISASFKTTHLWFLPRNHISHISLELERVLRGNSFFDKHFGVMRINSIEKTDLGDVKKKIERKEEDLLRKNKGLIILAGGMLNLGITLRRCNVVCLFNNTTSSDTIIQQMFRCMTEAEDKKCGIVVDFDNNRVLNTLINIGSNIKGNTADKIKYVIEHNIIWIDKDHFGSKYNTKEVIKTVVNAWENVLSTHEEYTVNALTKEFENVDFQLSITDQKLLDDIIHVSKTGVPLNDLIKMSDIDNGACIPSGVKKTKLGRTIPLLVEKKNHINFTKEVATPILKFLSILFFRDDVSIDIKTLLRMDREKVVIQYIADIFSINAHDSKKIYGMFIELFSACL